MNKMLHNLTLHTLGACALMIAAGSGNVNLVGAVGNATTGRLGDVLVNSSGATTPDTVANKSICQELCIDEARPRMVGKVPKVTTVMPGRAMDIPKA